jgi:hypothetical protein
MMFSLFFPDKNAKPDNSKRGDPNDPRVRLKRDCVGLLAAFKLSDPCDQILIVANTHIYWQVKQNFTLFGICFHNSLHIFVVFSLSYIVWQLSSKCINFCLMHNSVGTHNGSM